VATPIVTKNADVFQNCMPGNPKCIYTRHHHRGNAENADISLYGISGKRLSRIKAWKKRLILPLSLYLGAAIF